MFKYFLKDGKTLDPRDAASSVREGIAWLTISVLVLLTVAIVFSCIHYEPEDVLFLLQASIRLRLVGLLFGTAILAVVVTVTLGLFQLIENSLTGMRLESKVILLASLLITAGLVFGGLR